MNYYSLATVASELLFTATVAANYNANVWSVAPEDEDEAGSLGLFYLSPGFLIKSKFN